MEPPMPPHGAANDSVEPPNAKYIEMHNQLRAYILMDYTDTVMCAPET